MDKQGARRFDRSQGQMEPQPVATKSNRLNSTELFRGTREVIIEHIGDEYRLRLTNQGKLILTK